MHTYSGEFPIPDVPLSPPFGTLGGHIKYSAIIAAYINPVAITFAGTYNVDASYKFGKFGKLQILNNVKFYYSIGVKLDLSVAGGLTGKIDGNTATVSLNKGIAKLDVYVGAGAGVFVLGQEKRAEAALYGSAMIDLSSTANLILSFNQDGITLVQSPKIRIDHIHAFVKAKWTGVFGLGVLPRVIPGNFDKLIWEFDKRF